MNIYEEIGIRPFINAAGCMFTRYGGSIMPEPVVAAMAEASKHFVNIFDLQDKMGKAIATTTRNEAAFVSCGAASGITLCVATCIAGTDPQAADSLPDTHALRHQVIMPRNNRGTEADPAIRAAGGRIIDVGTTNQPPTAEQILGAINERTAAILFLASGREEDIKVKAIVEGAHERNIPVLIDGAGALPPRENLWHYTRNLGADTFITSGGKALRGPQSTGLVLGLRNIIEGCKFHSSPNLRIGRGMKVGKEEFAGIYTALKLFLAEDTNAQAATHIRQIAAIFDCVKNLANLKLSLKGSQLQIDLSPPMPPMAAETAAQKMLEGEPSILLSGRAHRITVQATLLQPGEEQIVGQRLKEVLQAML